MIVDVAIDEFRWLINDLNSMAFALDNPEGAYDQIADYLREIEEQQFDSEGGFSGGWEALSPETVKRKVKQGLDSRALHATLRLRESLTRLGDPDQIFEVDRSGMRFGTSVEYAGFHADGTSRMPRRPPVEITEDHTREIANIMMDWIMVGQVNQITMGS